MKDKITLEFQVVAVNICLDHIRTNVLPSVNDFNFKLHFLGVQSAPTGRREVLQENSCMKQQRAGEKKGLIAKEQRGVGRTRRYVIKGWS